MISLLAEVLRPWSSKENLDVHVSTELLMASLSFKRSNYFPHYAVISKKGHTIREKEKKRKIIKGSAWALFVPSSWGAKLSGGIQELRRMT